MGFVKEFKEFAMKGNVMDMAVGVIIGGAFGKIVSSLVDDVLMPLIGTIKGHEQAHQEERGRTCSRTRTHQRGKAPGRDPRLAQEGQIIASSNIWNLCRAKSHTRLCPCFFYVVVCYIIEIQNVCLHFNTIIYFR